MKSRRFAGSNAPDRGAGFFLNFIIKGNPGRDKGKFAKTEFSNRKAEADRPLRLPGPQGAAGRSALHRVSSFAALGTPGASQSLFNGRGQSLFNNAKTARPIGRAVCMAAREGFEPSQTESESVVLPLHNLAKRKNYYTAYPPFVKRFFQIFPDFFAKRLSKPAVSAYNKENTSPGRMAG